MSLLPHPPHGDDHPCPEAKAITLADLTPHQIAILMELADQIHTGKKVWKWLRALGLTVTAVAACAYTLGAVYHQYFLNDSGHH